MVHSGPPQRSPYPHARLGPRDAIGDHDGVLFAGTDLTAVHADGARFLDCTLVGTDMSESTFHEARFAECELREVRGVGVSWSEASLRDSTLVDCRLAALDASGADWSGVRIVGGRVDYLNLRRARLRDVTFEDVMLTDLDLTEATLERVSFAGCTLTAPVFAGARLAGVDLRGATVREPDGIGSLKGATMSRTQVIELAEWFAHEVGIRVED